MRMSRLYSSNEASMLIGPGGLQYAAMLSTACAVPKIARSIAPRAPTRALLLEEVADRPVSVRAAVQRHGYLRADPDAENRVEQQRRGDTQDEARLDERLEDVRETAVKTREDVAAQAQDERKTDDEGLARVEQAARDDLDAADQDEAAAESQRR